MDLPSLLVAQGSVGSSGPSALDWALYIAVGLLTVGLLVIGWVRRRQISPLTKCLALSIHAHLLLFVFAHSTRVTVERPLPRTTTAVPMRLVEWDERWDEEASEAIAEEGEALDHSLDSDAAVAVASAEIEVDESNRLTQESRLETPAPLESEPSVEPPSELPSVEKTEPLTPESPESEPLPSLPRNATRRESPPAPPSSFADEIWDDRLGSPPLDTTAELFDVTRIEAPAETAMAALEAGLDHLVSPVSTETPGTERIERDPAWIDSTPLVPVSMERDQPQQAGSLQQWLRENSAPLRLGDGAPLPDLFRLRQIAQARALPPETTWESEQAVDAGLGWLARSQEPDGRWDASRFGAGREDRILDQDRGGAGKQADTGISGLALLAFLGRGNTHLEGPYRENVQRGLEFLIRSQREDGDLSGDAELFARMYSHGIATLAMSEALALSGDPRLKEPTDRALVYSREAQDPQTGGWRYRPRERGDMSQFGWQVLALVSGEQAGIRIPESTRLGMHRFLDACSSGRAGGRCSYRSGEAVSATMTAEGLACRYFLDYQRDPGRVREAVETALAADAGHSVAEPDLYYLYYTSLALHQHGGSRWESWNQELHRMLLPLQLSGGDESGSWDPKTRWGGYGGRVYSTSMAILCLEIPYRHLPLYRLDESLPH